MQRRRSCPVRDKIMRRYDQELLGAPLWCTTQQEGLWIQGVNVVVPQRRVFVCASKLALDESLSHQHMGAMYHRGRSPSASTNESHRGDGIMWMIRSCWELHFDKQYNGKDYRFKECETTDSRVMGLAVLWYRRGGTFVEASIPCSYGGRVLVAKGVEEVENAKANSKYQDRAERQEARELHKTSVNELLIKIVENEGLRVDAGVLDQGTK
ncbi:hypothetical protein BHM03_00048261 [Ensete ventricosum]|nr:hypothetical protein BHM03_00048261 [Ensete ventricosum]